MGRDRVLNGREKKFNTTLFFDHGLIVFTLKKANSIGLQLADLIAYPLGRHVLKPHEENLAFKIIEQKFHKFPNYLQKGLKISPKNSEGIKPFDLQEVTDFAKA